MMKKFVALVLVLGMVLGLGTAHASTADPFAVTEEITIDFWHSMGMEAGVAAIEELVAGFTAQYPNIHVNLAFYSSGDLKAKVMASAAADNADTPALTMTSLSGISAFSKAAIIENLDPYIAGSPDFDLGAFYPGFLSAMNHNGQYALPFSNSCAVVYLNNDLLAAAGAKAPETWSDLGETLTAVSKDGVKGIGVIGTDTYNFGFLLWNNGAKMLTEDDTASAINSPEALETLNQIQTWYNEGKLEWYTSGTDMLVAFKEGQIAMCMTSIANFASLKSGTNFTLGLAFPVEGAVQRSSELGGSGLIIPSCKSQAEKNAAWQLMKWLTSANGNAKVATATGYLPYRADTTETEEYKAFVAANPELSAMRFDCIIPQQTFHASYSSMRTVISDNITLALQTNGSMADALKAIESGLNDYCED